MKGFSVSLLSKKNALVIGGTSGIGKSIVENLSKCGADVLVVGRSEISYQNICFSEETSNSFAKIDLNELTISQYFTKFPEKIPKNRFDIIVATAGTEFIRPFNASSQSDFEKSCKTTIDVAIDIACQLSKRKYLNESASIVFISSISVEYGISGLGIYSASRAGVTAISRVLASELYTRNIRVNTILAGATKTPMHEKIISRLSEFAIEKYRSSHPLGFGEPQDIANMAVFLSSDLAKWITGSTICVDGGYSGIKVN